MKAEALACASRKADTYGMYSEGTTYGAERGVRAREKQAVSVRSGRHTRSLLARDVTAHLPA